MNKVGIITLCGNYNYGNKLQNYALQEILKKYHYKVFTIWNERYSKKSYKRTKKSIQIYKDFINHLLRRNYRYYKLKLFKKFNHQYLNYSTTRVYSFEENKLRKIDYDKFFIGSDQIWNCTFYNENFGKIEFAIPVDSNKVFSYAASFGISTVPKDQKEIFRNGLNHLNKISVREQNGIELVKELSEREDAICVLDPTMLLSKEEWKQIEKRPSFLKENENYILLYFLGKSISINRIRLLAKENNCKVVCINTDTYEYWHTGPLEFVYLIDNAKMVLTDSFHACTFSIIFNKLFYVFERNSNDVSMISRIESFLSKYDILNRKIKSVDEIRFDNFKLSDEIISKINNDKEKSIKFIEDCLKEE